MRSTFYGFEIAKTGLFTSQRQLDITSHNIANVDTVGYSRQRLSAEALPPVNNVGLFTSSRKGESGRGVNPICVEQIRNPFLDKQYRNETTKAMFYLKLEERFYDIEQLFNSELTGSSSASDASISGMFQDFYNTLYLFQEDVSTESTRTTLLKVAQNLCTTMNTNAQKLQDQYKNLDETIVGSVKHVNTVIDQIADLNRQIHSYELSGARANDLRDARNLLLDDLSGYMDITYRETDQNHLIVEFQGHEMINHVTTDKLKAVDTQNDLYTPGGKIHQVYWVSDAANATPLVFGDKCGELGALFRARDGATTEYQGIPFVMSQLDELARKIVAEMNFLHVQGFGIPHSTNGGLSNTKLNFFDDANAMWEFVSNDPDVIRYSTDSGVSWTNVNIHDVNNINTVFKDVNARNMKVSKDIEDSVWNIAGSDEQLVSGGQMGNNNMASRYVKLVNRKDDNGNNDNFNSYYKSIITGVGAEMKKITSMATNQTVVINQLHNQRQSIMGVSLDEEMTNIIRFGHSYNAASRVITTIDEELDMLINRMGLVGRG